MIAYQPAGPEHSVHPAVCAVFLLKRQKLLCRHGPCKHIALQNVAALPDEVVCLLACLHAFGRDLQPQAMRQRHDGSDDGAAVFLLGQVFDKAAVNLEPLHWQLPQVRQ